MNSRINILFIDDEQNVLNGIERSIRNDSKDWDVIYLSNSLEARDRILTEQFDVVVSDIRMPHLSGLELLEEVKKELGFNAPEFIIVTGEADRQLKKKALNLDATDLLSKPVQSEELLARLNNAIRLKKAKNELTQTNRLLQEQLIQSQKMELVGLMASGVAHDFGNVLTVIMNYLQMIQLKYGKSSEFLREITKIQNVSVHGQRITSQILKFVRKQEQTFETVNLNQLINEVMEVLRVSIPKIINLKFEPAAEKIHIFGDYTQIFQIIMNLCLNSAKALNGSGDISFILARHKQEKPFEFMGRTVPQGDYVRLTVADNGPGFDQTLLQNMAEDPLQIKKSIVGTGVGLSVVAICVRNHTGFYQIDSIPKKGTQFSVFLPLAQEKVAE